MKKIDITFLGSSDFSIPTLQALINEDRFTISSIFTTMPKKSGRGQKIQPNIVQQFAKDHNIENLVFTSDSLKNLDLQQKLASGYLCDIMIVVSYANLIPESFLQLVKFAVINLHPSSLPKWRGAAPIERAIEAGDNNIDICVIEVVKKLDAGDIFAKTTLDVTNLHATEVFEKVSYIGSKMILDTAMNIYNGKANKIPQKEEGFCYAKKIEKSELFLDFNENILNIYNKIRAFNKCGGCWILLQNKRLKILYIDSYNLNYVSNKRGLDFNDSKIYFNGGFIIPKVVQLEGKKAINFIDFLRGLQNI